MNPAEPEPGRQGTWSTTGPGPILGSPSSREEGRLALEEAWRDAQMSPGKRTVGNRASLGPWEGTEKASELGAVTGKEVRWRDKAGAVWVWPGAAAGLRGCRG